MKKICLYVALMATVLCVGCGAWRSPGSAAKHFYEAIAEGEFDKALTYTTVGEQIDTELYMAIMEKVQLSIAERGGIKQIKIVDESIDQEQTSATVTTLIIFEDGSQQEETCDATRVDKRWKVDVNLDSK